MLNISKKYLEYVGLNSADRLTQLIACGILGNYALEMNNISKEDLIAFRVIKKACYPEDLSLEDLILLLESEKEFPEDDIVLTLIRRCNSNYKSSKFAVHKEDNVNDIVSDFYKEL